jgi:DNA-binding MarR family transcriptional regulator
MAQTFINGKLKAYGLSSGLFYFILELLEQDGLSMQDLSKAVYVDNAHTTRAVNKLIQLGYVTKEVDPGDLRFYRVYLTEKGKKISVTIKSVLVEWANLVTMNVTEEELRILYGVFDKYYANAREYMVNGKGP